MEGFGGIVGVSAGGKKAVNPGSIDTTKLAGARRKEDHDTSTQITPVNKEGQVNHGLLSIVGSGMGGGVGNNVASAAAKRK